MGEILIVSLMLMTLLDLQEIRATRSPGLLPLPQSYSVNQPTTRQLQERLQLIIRQLHLNLPVQPLLNHDPLLSRWVSEIQETLPTLFLPKKRIQLHAQVTAPLMVNEKAVFIQVQVNLGFKHETPKLFEWALRNPKLNWSDRVKLWTTAQYFNVDPEDLRLIVVPLHRKHSVQKTTHYWNQKRHWQTERSLIKVLSDQPPVKIHSSNSVNEKYDLIPNLDQIDEIPI